MTMISRSYLPSSVLYATIGLGYKNESQNGDVTLRWGGDRSFADAITEWASQGTNGHRFASKVWGHQTRSKETAPWALWRILKAPEKNPEKGYEPAKTRGEAKIVAATALSLDIDEGNVSAKSLEAALYELGWEAAFYTTWTAREDDLRWRVVIPLATPHTMEGWGDFYSQKLTEFEKALEVHHGSPITLDKTAKYDKQVQILPHRVATKSDKDKWFPEEDVKVVDAAIKEMKRSKYGVAGFPEALIYSNRGSALSHASTYDVMKLGKRTLSVARFGSIVGTDEGPTLEPEPPTEPAKPRSARASKAEAPSPSPEPAPSVEATQPATKRVRKQVDASYEGKADSEFGGMTALTWQTKGMSHRPTLCKGLDGAEYFAEYGIHAEQGKRHEALVVSMWCLHRAGVCHTEIGKKVDRMISKSKKADQEYLTKEAGKYIQQIITLEKEAAKMEVAINAAQGRGKVDGDATGPTLKRLFARILSRSKHCYEPTGGALCQEQIAQCMGLPHGWKSAGVRIVRAMLGNCERAGLLVATGEKKERRYRLISPV